MRRNVRHHSTPPPCLSAKAGAVFTLLMSCLAMIMSLGPKPACAQSTPPYDWRVTDQNGNTLQASGGAYGMVGSYTSTSSISGNYLDLYSFVQQPDSTAEDAFFPIPQSLSGSLASGQPIQALAGADNTFNLTSGGSSWYFGPNDELANGSAGMSASGSFYARFNWNPLPMGPQGPPPMPSYIDVLLTPGLNVQASMSPYGSPPTTNGLSVTATVSDNLNDYVTSNGVSTISTVSKHLVRVPVSGGQAVVTMSGTASVTATNNVPGGQFVTVTLPNGQSASEPQATNGGTQCTGQATLNGSVQLDNRDVTISCPTIETSYYKGWKVINGINAPVAMPNQLGANGSMIGDSVLTYLQSNNSNQPAGWNMLQANFVGNATNFQDPTYSWVVTSPGTIIGGANTNPNCEVSVYEANGSSCPVSTTTTLTATDSDGTVGVNTYAVTWHLPYEPTQLYKTTYTKHKVGEARVGPIPVVGTYLVQASEPQQIDVSAVFDAGAAITDENPAVAGLFEIASTIAKITDTKYTYTGEAAYTGASNDTPNNFTTAVGDMNEVYQGDPNIDPPSFAGNPMNYNYCHMYLYVVEKDSDRYWYADGYNVNGYDGNSFHTIDVHQCDMMETQPYFVQYKNPDGTPYTGPL